MQAQPTAPVAADEEAFRRPLKEQDIKDLLNVVELLRSSLGEEAGRKAAAPPAAGRRIGMIIGDVVAILGEEHARDYARELDLERVPKEGTVWIDAMIGYLHQCAEKRFEYRGGNDAYLRSKELILAYRAALEGVLRAVAKLPRPGTPWPAPRGVAP
jgi:hypothetical protein